MEHLKFSRKIGIRINMHERFEVREEGMISNEGW